MSASGPKTLLEAVVRRLRACASEAGDVAQPAAILWTDPEGAWAPLAPKLRALLPELLVLGDYAPELGRGPAIWMRCVIEGTIVLEGLNSGRPPVLLLAGFSRQALRAGEDCPAAIRPLVELMYRGTLWLQPGGRDWSPQAFLTSKEGLKLEVSKDEATKTALARALPELAVAPLEALRGRRLSAEDFDRLLTSDPIRDLLRWMGDPEGAPARLGVNAWGAFRSQCRERFGFDPEKQPDVIAGERLARGEGPWREVWERFVEAPTAFPGIEGLLRRSQPSGHFTFGNECWPEVNEGLEAELAKGLAVLPQIPHAEACARVRALDLQHGERRSWVWSKLGAAPLAALLVPLCRLAEVAARPMAGVDLEALADDYRNRGWEGDAAAWEALAAAPTAAEGLVAKAVHCLLVPWLEHSAQVFQRALARSPLPSPLEQGRIQAAEEECLLFADGLRYDLGRRLAERLEAAGQRWAAAPTVTASAKVAVSPVADLVQSGALGADFSVLLAPEGKPANAAALRAALASRGYQLLEAGNVGAPESDRARGWLESGEIDALGHQIGARLAKQLGGELERLSRQVEELLEAGWRSVRVVTDHGWLLAPEGLPRVDLPKHLTLSRWSRCAVIAGAGASPVPLHPWTWNPMHAFAFAPGAACFNKSEAYAHGGLSLQECLTPTLLVRRSGTAAARLEIESLVWRGLRCHVGVQGAGPGVVADLRLGGPGGTSVIAKAKPLDGDGAVSLVLAGDEHERAELMLVLLDEHNRILAQQPTRVGVDS
jgi:hypothetical protein